MGARLRGDRVAELRKAVGLLQTDLAEQLGTRDRRVSEWERGEQQPHPRHLVAIAQALAVEPLSLLDVDQQDPPVLALRLAAGLTLQELSEASGVPQTSYLRLETGVSRGQAPDAVLQALAAALGVPREQLHRAVVRSRAERGRPS